MNCCPLNSEEDEFVSFFSGRRDDEPPLINGWIPFIGKALQFGKDAHKFLEEYKRKYGDVFTVHIAGVFEHLIPAVLSK